jgi:urease beta subunit
MIPGEYILADGHIEINAGKPVTTIVVVNTGDRPVQVGSHFHFYEVNSKMQFDREIAFGQRLNIAAGTAVRFEPGEEKTIELVRQTRASDDDLEHRQTPPSDGQNLQS